MKAWIIVLLLITAATVVLAQAFKYRLTALFELPAGTKIERFHAFDNGEVWLETSSGENIVVYNMERQ